MHAGEKPPHLFILIEKEPTEEEKTAGYSENGYYFLDETESQVIGPFGTPELAVSFQNSYVAFLKDGTPRGGSGVTLSLKERTKQEEALAQVIIEIFGSKPEYSGRFCGVCGKTTPHCRSRGRPPVYEKVVSWMCSICLLPGGTLHMIIMSLLRRQGDIAK